MKKLPSVVCMLIFCLLYPGNFGAVLAADTPDFSQRILECGQKSIELNQALQKCVSDLLKAADSYDVENYRKLDDRQAELYEQLDANYLESCMYLEAQLKTFTEHDENWQKAQAALENMRQVTARSMRRSKMYSDKSSAIFYLCFGMPVESSHYARLSLNLAEAGVDDQDKIPEIAFYAGNASLWSGDYSSAEEQLKRALSLNPANHFASYSLADLYMAQGQAAKAIDVLVAARKLAPDNEMRGNLDRSLALAYTLTKQRDLARQSIASARRELADESKKQFAAVSQESSGIVAALSGDYEGAERKLSEALPRLQLSPINLGNRLEAAQASLWRSYCKGKLGDKIGAAEDRRYALTVSDEAVHISRLARMLDPLFGYKEVLPPMGQIRDRWAVVVGLGNFADPKVPKLRYPTKDAQDVQKFLVDTAGFKADHIRLLLDEKATRSAICDSLTGQWLPSVVKPGDLVFFFVSSHGTPNYKELGALNSLVTYDTQVDHLFSTSLPMQSIVRMMRTRLKKQHCFVVLDTCYSGGLGAPGEEAKSSANADPELLVISHHQLLVSSSDSKERSWESRRYQNSVFTRQMLDTIAAHPRYEDFRSIFTQIADRVCQEVTADFNNKQTPRLAGLWSGKGLIESNRNGGHL